MRLRLGLLLPEAGAPCHNCWTDSTEMPETRPMQWFQSKAMAGALALATAVVDPASRSAQTSVTGTEPITVTDARGAALAGATVKDSTGRLLGATDANGKLAVACAAPCPVRVSAPG